MAGILYRSANISFKGILPKRKYAFIVACYSPSPRPAPLFADASSSLMPPPASSPRIWYQTLPNRRVSPDDGISCILRRFRRYGFLIVFRYCLSTRRRGCCHCTGRDMRNSSDSPINICKRIPSSSRIPVLCVAIYIKQPRDCGLFFTIIHYTLLLPSRACHTEKPARAMPPRLFSLTSYRFSSASYR